MDIKKNTSRIVVWSLAAILVALLVVKVVFVGYYQIPQNGMFPGLPAGSRILTLKRAYSVPADVERGDIVVFVREENGKRYNYIWRVVALPGETVEASDESLSVNSQPVQREHLRDEHNARIYLERIGPVSYEIALANSPGSSPPDASLKVPPDQFFVMGDNRFDARDSRYFGPIPFTSIVGKEL